MRDLNKIAEKLDGLWSGGKMRHNKPVKTPTTDDKIKSDMNKMKDKK